MPVRRPRRKHSKRALKSASSTNLQTALATGAVSLGIAALAPSAHAATFTVTNLADSGAGSLRDAVAQANTNPGADVITFQSGLTGTILLTTGQLKMYESVDVQGPGAAVITVNGNSSGRVFYVYTPGNAPVNDFTISGLTITNGAAVDGAGIIDFGENLTLNNVIVNANSASGQGGGIKKSGYPGTLHILSSTISGNSASKGGGISFYNSDTTADIQDSVISGNSATNKGGGIYLYGVNFDVTIARTTISGNTATNSGAGIYDYRTTGGRIIVDSSTISGNTAGGNGGGIYLYSTSDPLVITNSTISGNNATYGGGIALYYSCSCGGATISFTTITKNDATADGGGIITNHTLPISLTNSIVGDNTAPSNPDLSGGDFTLNYTLVQNPGSATVVTGSGVITGVNPGLGPLANNGGTTQTHKPLSSTSPGVDTGDPAYAPPPALDQRGTGFPRKSGPRVDMGAVELEGGTFTLSAATYTVAENGASILITVNRANGSDPASVNYATSNGTATAGADYSNTSGTLNFAANQTTATFSVPILDDNLVEGPENFNVTLSAPSAGASLGAPSTAVVTITDFEEGRLQFSNPTYSVNENGGTVTITVTRTNGSDGTVGATYNTSNGSATAPADYTSTTGSISFINGDTAPKTFNVPIIDDTLVEGNETFNVNLSAPTGGATIGAQSSAVVTIVDFEPGFVQFSTGSTTIAEDQGPLVITVTRTGGSDGPLTVNYATANGTATSPADYAGSSGSVTFAPGDTAPKTISIPIVNDGISEPPETFTVTLSGPSAGSVGSPATITATIVDPAIPIPFLDTFGKLMLAFFSMLAGLFVINKNKLMGFFLTALFVGAIAAPVMNAAPRVQPNKTKGHLHLGARKQHQFISSTSASETTYTINFSGGGSITFPKSVGVFVDKREPRRQRVPFTRLVAGTEVLISDFTVHDRREVRVRIIGFGG
jgi:parallel beta-helix repeat protein